MALFILFMCHLLLLLLKGHSKCPPSFRCRNFTLQFPFTDIKDLECGLLPVEGCDYNEHLPHPRFQKEFGQFPKYIEIIGSISGNSVMIHDSFLQASLRNRSCRALSKISLTDSPSVSFTFSPNLTFFTCFKAEQHFKDYKSKECEYSHVYYANNDSVIGDTSDIPPGCSLVQLPKSNNDSGDLFDRLSARFTVEWNVSEDCSKCYRGGGQCLTDNQNQFYCKLLQDMSWQRGLKIPSLNFDLGEDEASPSADKGNVDPQVTVSIPGGSVAIPDAVPVTSVRPSQGEKSQVSSAAEKRGAEQALHKEGKKVKYGSKDKDKIISEKIPDKVKNKGKGIRRNPNDYFTLELPKSLAEMSKDDCVDFVRTLHTPDDNFFYKDFSPEQIQRSAIQRFVQFTTLFSRLVTAEGPLAVPELRDEIRKKDEELAKISSELKVVSKEKEEFKERVSALEKELEDVKGKIVSGKAEAFSAGVKSGVELCRRRLFSSVVGQNFLKELHEGLIEAYRRSALYLEHMGPHMGHYIAHGFKSAYLRARKLGFSGRLDATNLEEGLTPSPEFQGDPDEDVGHPWWSPVIKSAVQTLINEELPDPELPRAEEMIYEVDDTSSSGAQTFEQLPELGSIADTTPPTFVD